MWSQLRKASHFAIYRYQKRKCQVCLFDYIFFQYIIRYNITVSFLYLYNLINYRCPYAGCANAECLTHDVLEDNLELKQHIESINSLQK